MSEGQLIKLTITAFDDTETVQSGSPSGPEFVAQFNPESFTVTDGFEYVERKSNDGEAGQEAKYRATKPRTFSLDFLLDGTGASGSKLEVKEQIELFKKTIGYNREKHRPRFLLVTWGSFISTCVVESFTTEYKLFRPNGTPLRALISATFMEHKSTERQELEKGNESPDRTHARLVIEGDSLWLISQRVYEDPRYYFHVAEANTLDNLRFIETGQTLFLPPLE